MSRICPGKHVGEANVFITIATLLATLNFAPPPPSEGPIVRESDSNMVLCVVPPMLRARWLSADGAF